VSTTSPSMSSTRVSSSNPPDSTTWWYSPAVSRWTSSMLATSVILSPPPHQPADRAHQLARLIAAVAVAEQAHARVVVEQAQRDAVEPVLDRGDRREDVDAVGVLGHHARDVADLGLDR